MTLISWCVGQIALSVPVVAEIHHPMKSLNWDTANLQDRKRHIWHQLTIMSHSTDNQKTNCLRMIFVIWDKSTSYVQTSQSLTSSGCLAITLALVETERHQVVTSESCFGTSSICIKYLLFWISHTFFPELNLLRWWKKHFAAWNLILIQVCCIQSSTHLACVSFNLWRFYQ